MGDIDRDPDLDRAPPPQPDADRVTGTGTDTGATRDENGAAAKRPGELETRPDDSSDARPPG